MKPQSCLREFARYSSLNIFGMLALSFYILSDTFFMANRLGSDGLAALNLAIPVYSFIHGSGLMLGIGGATRYSISTHQGCLREGSAAFTHTLWMGAGLTILFFFSGLFLSGPITALLGADEAVFAMSRTYIQVLLLFSPAFLLNDILLCFVRNDGAPARAMLATTIGSLSNVLLDYLFIFVMDMGIFGAVFSTALAPIISMAVLAPFFLRRKNRFHPISCSPAPALGLRITAAGLPSLMTEVSSGLVIIVFNIILLSLRGNLGVAAYAVVANLSLMVFTVYTGIAQGSQPLLSRYYGAGNRDNVRAILRYAVTTTLVLSALLYGLIFLGAGPIASLFNREGNASLQAMASWGLKLYFIACPFVGLNIVLSTYFTSTDLPQPAHVISLLRGFLLILPLSFLLSHFWGIDGLWLTFPITEGLVMGLAVLFYHRSKKNRPLLE